MVRLQKADWHIIKRLKMAVRKKANGIAAMLEVVANDNFERGHAEGQTVGYEAGWAACEQDLLAQLEKFMDKSHGKSTKPRRTRKATKTAKTRRTRRTSKKAKPTRVLGKRIASMGLRDATTAKLLGNGLTTVGKVVKFHREQPKGLRSIYRFGATSVDEVREAFKAIKVNLDGDE